MCNFDSLTLNELIQVTENCAAMLKRRCTKCELHGACPATRRLSELSQQTPSRAR